MAAIQHQINFALSVADTTLILLHRNSECCGHGPVLEQDIAITNIALDLLGQSRNFYQYAAALINDVVKSGGAAALPALSEAFEGEVNEDTLAYLRNERAYKNLLLVEQPNGDWAQTILRQYLFSQYQLFLFEQLQYHEDTGLAAIATKSVKETAYHLRWSSEWVIRLGDGTGESHQRMLNAIGALWRYTGEMFIPADYEREMNINVELLQQQWSKSVKKVFKAATLSVPDWKIAAKMQTGGKQGIHTEQLGYILAVMQYMQRAYPGCEW
ncbi:MAG TPA: phenylacetate-CoA oxygenase subunit PaaC [Ferruginibacter sp.]|nr:phenylacetate-CoA oxygenase subunit PaaC [Ferruginibacter sp.]HMP20652.1 phenylacetate-CoA oxygenase subunit PaaC [Ferruginibacter sp.]